jgi:hypothetical protein
MLLRRLTLFAVVMIACCVSEPSFAKEVDKVNILLEELSERGLLSQEAADEIKAKINGEVLKQKEKLSKRDKILPHGDTQVSLIDDFTVRIGLQYRVMYNYSNIPLSGVTSVDDTDAYDFFRQRMRFNLDVQSSQNVGGFLQLEYRGGWGGSSPAYSDPRADADPGLSANAFNRLEARGVRYGYIYYTPEADNTYLAAGIIPLSDRLGDTLFSADWDFNVGGITYRSTVGRTDYRLGFVRLIDGVSSSDSSTLDDNGDLVIADIAWPWGERLKLGGHLYYLDVDRDAAVEAGLTTNGKISQGWYALSGSLALGRSTLNSFICLNDGDYDGTDNTGLASKLEAVIPLDQFTFKLMAIFATGDREGDTADNQFRTIQGIVGTEGYWAYTHIFTANGASDVNDLGVGLDNDGRGLTTIQGKIETSLNHKLDLDLFAGWFQASEDNSDGNKDMGTEFGCMFTYALAQKLNFQLGFSYALLGDYYRNDDGGPDDLYETFSRFQLQF